MTAYVQPGDKVILYVGNMTDGEIQNLKAVIQSEGVELLAALGRTDIAPAYMGPPSILVVIEAPDRCENCGHSDGDTIEGLTVNQAIIDEMLGRHEADCLRVDAHHAHVWAVVPLGPSSYCKGIPS